METRIIKKCGQWFDQIDRLGKRKIILDTPKKALTTARKFNGTVEKFDRITMVKKHYHYTTWYKVIY